MTKIPKIILNSGYSIPVVGLGTWQSKPGEVCQAVKDAIDCGYRHIDCALIYGNEAEIGDAIHAKISEGKVKREDLFITSKLWNTFHSRDLVLTSVKESLKDLKVDYLDLYLIHWPMGYKEGGARFPKDENEQWLFSDVDYMESWAAMEECVANNLIRSIGVSNFNSQQVSRIIENAKIKPAVLQVECHPYLNQEKLLSFCKSKGIAFTGYSPLGAPMRAWAKEDDPVLIEEPKIKEIAAKYNKSPAQVLIRYQVQRGVICIPKSVTKSRIESNLQVFDFELSEDDMSVIHSMNCNARALHLTWVNHHPYYPFNVEF